MLSVQQIAFDVLVNLIGDQPSDQTIEFVNIAECVNTRAIFIDATTVGGVNTPVANTR